MTSKASTPEVNNIPQILTMDDNKNQFENMDCHAEDFQATEQDPCIPTSNNVKINQNSVVGSRNSLENKKDYMENEKDERIIVSENVEYPLPNSKTPKKKLSFVNKLNRRSDGSKKFSWSNAEFEAKVRKKYGLTHQGYIIGIALLCVTVLAFLIILILGITWPRTSHSQQYPICTKPGCLIASVLMLPKLNRAIPPCKDFYGYVCGSWAKNHSKPPPTRSRWGLQEELHLRQSEVSREIIARFPYLTSSSSLTWKLQRFYDSCVTLDSVETDKEQSIKKIISEMGGWEVMRDFDMPNWNTKDAIVKFHSKHGVKPFFQVSVVPDPKDSDKNILKLSPSPLGLPHKSYYYRDRDDRMSSSYRRYLMDIVRLMGASQQASSSFSETIFYFERRIIEGTPPDSELEDIRKHEILPISSLASLAPSIPIFDTVNALFPKARITEDTEVLVTSVHYFQNISMILSSSDSVTLNNYLMWLLTKEYAPYLSQEFRDTYHVYQRDMTGALEPLERWEFCIRTLEKFVSFGLAASLERTIPKELRKTNEKIVGDIFDSVREAVKDSVTKSKWIDLELYKHLVKKLDGMALQVGIPDPLLESSYLDKYYKSFFVQKAAFFANIYNGNTFLEEDRMEQFMNPREEYKWLSTMSTTFEVKWVPAANKIVVPQRILREPFYDPDYPSAVLYGTLGVQIAKEIVSSLLKESALYSADGTLINDNGLVANLSYSSVDHQINCLKAFIQDEILDIDADVANRTSLNAFIDISAVKQALKALKKVSRSAEHVHQPGLEDFEDESLFYTSYGQTLCVAQTAQQSDLERTTSKSLNNTNTLEIVTSQSKSFADSFQCSSSSNVCKHIL